MSMIFKNLNGLHMTARACSAQVGVGWTALDGTRYHVWLEVARNEATGRSEPTLPYRVRVERPMGHKTAKPVLYKNPLIRADGSHPKRGDPDHFDTRYLDASAAAHALVVEEALRRAQTGGMYEAAIAESEREERERETKQRAERAAELRRKLTERRNRLIGMSRPQALNLLDAMLASSDDDVLEFCNL